MSINKIIIVGGGSAGWMTAATFIRSFPDKQVSVIESKDVPIVGVGESTIAGLRRWTSYLGIDEKSFISYTNASYKMSIKFTDFYKKDFGSFHYPFGNPSTSVSDNPITDWHIKKFLYPDTPVEDMVRCLFPAAALFENGKYINNLDGSLDNFSPKDDVVYHFDAVRFGAWLRDEYCIPRGVNHIVATVTEINTDEDGVAGLVLDSGDIATADLYVDCTGFRSLLLEQALGEPFESYSNIIPNNKAWAVQIPYVDRSVELEGFTNCTAIDNGWCWNTPLWSRLGTGYVYCDEYTTDEDALDQFKSYLMSDKMVIPRTQEQIDELTFRNIPMKSGIHTRTFVKNVVAIGLAAGFLEPLESNGLYSVHEFLFKLVDILKRNDISQFDRDMYNVSTRDQFDSFAKFVALHYALSHRDDTEYWKAVRNRAFSDKYGSPYFPYQGKTDAFGDLINRYMENWSYAPQGGIPYVGTGLQLFLVNEARRGPMERFFGISLEQYVGSTIQKWEDQKKRWNEVVANAPTLEEYLKEHFYE